MSINTLENKRIFFAQYYWQDVLMKDINGKNGLNTLGPDKIYHATIELADSYFNPSDNESTAHSYLELRPLSAIDKEEIKDIEIMQYKNILGMFEGKEELLPSNITDYLRRRGIAVPWNRISVEKLLEMEWIKLSE